MKRRTARQFAVQALYQIDMTACQPDYALHSVLEGHQGDPFLTDVVFGTEREQLAIDEHIRQALTNWKLERLSKVDRSVLRLAVYELIFAKQSPPAIIINEAVEMGKLFGTEENGKFINGVLARIVKQNSHLIADHASFEGD